MSQLAFTGFPPPAYAWLSPACRPSPDEVWTYAQLIRAQTQESPEPLATCLREAELQLWTWRDESCPPPRRRRARPALAASAGENAAG